jgi:hypothetical protein
MGARPERRKTGGGGGQVYIYIIYIEREGSKARDMRTMCPV